MNDCEHEQEVMV